MRIENRMQLQLWREECKEKRQKENCCILVCGGTGCLAGGSDKIYARLKELTSNMDHVTVKIGEEIAHVGLKMSGAMDSVRWVRWFVLNLITICI